MGTVLIWLFLAGAVLCWQCMGLVASSFVMNKWFRAGFRGVILLHGAAAMGFALWIAIVVWQKGWVNAGALTGPVLMVLLYLTVSVVVLCQRWWRKVDTDGKLAPARRKLILALGVLGLMCVGLHVVTVGIMRSVAEATAAREVARLREKIAPTFDPPGPKPVSLDGSPVDGEAANHVFESRKAKNPNRWDALRDRVSSLSQNLLSKGEPFDTYRTKLAYTTTNTPEDDLEETLDETMARFKSEIDELREVTRVTPYIRHFTLDEFDSEVHCRNTMQIRDNCWILNLDAISAVRRGDFKRAVEDLNAMEQLAVQAFETRSMIGALVGDAIRCIIFSGAEVVLSAPNCHADELAGWTIQEGQNCRSWMAGRWDLAEYFMLKCVQSESRNDKSRLLISTGPKLPQNWYANSMVLACGMSHWVKEVNRASDALRGLGPQPLHQDVEALDPKEKLNRRTMAGYAFDVYRPIFSQAVVADAHTVVLQAAWAATRYRDQHGKYPDSLSALVGEGLTAVPIDPIDGKPLRMKVVEGGLIIYSVGSDGIDNGGDQPPTGYSWEGDDIAIYLGEAYHRRRAEFEKVCAARRAAEGK